MITLEHQVEITRFTTPWTNSVTQGTVNNAHTCAETEWTCICCLNYDMNMHTLVKVKLQ